MKNKISLTFILGLFTLSILSAQDSKKWFSNADILFVFPNAREYLASVESNGSRRGRSEDLEVEGFLLKSFGVQYAINYAVSPKFSVAAISGLQTFSDPDASQFQLGGGLKYFFVDQDNIYSFLQFSGHLSLKKENYKDGNVFRIGLGYPFLKRSGFNLGIQVLYEVNYLYMRGANPVLGLSGESPTSLINRSIGIGLGASF